MVEQSQRFSNSGEPTCQIHFMLESRLSEPELCTTAMCRDPDWSLASSRGHDPGIAGRWLANRTKYYIFSRHNGEKNPYNILYKVQSPKLTNNAILFNLPKTILKLHHRVKTIFQKVLKPVFLSLNFLKVWRQTKLKLTAVWGDKLLIHWNVEKCFVSIWISCDSEATASTTAI